MSKTNPLPTDFRFLVPVQPEEPDSSFQKLVSYLKKIIIKKKLQETEIKDHLRNCAVVFNNFKIIEKKNISN